MRAVKDMFVEKDSEPQPAPPAPAAASPLPHDEREMSPMEMSILCSNLARGCEKQYLPQQSEAFAQLAAFFRQAAEPVPQPDIQKLIQLIDQDLAEYPQASAILADAGDRGALRCQVWSEKVTRIPEIPFGPLPEGGRKDAGKHRRLCLHHLRVCLCGG